MTTRAKKSTKKNAKAKAKKTRGKKISATRAKPKAKRSTKKPSWKMITYAKIEKTRNSLGLTKSALAEALGVSNGTYHNWKRGTSVPHPNQQEVIVACLAKLSARQDKAAEIPTPSPMVEKSNVKSETIDEPLDLSHAGAGSADPYSHSGNGNGDNHKPRFVMPTEAEMRRTLSDPECGTCGGSSHSEATEAVSDPHAWSDKVLRAHSMTATAQIVAEYVKNSSEPVSSGSIVNLVKELRSAFA